MSAFFIVVHDFVHQLYHKDFNANVRDKVLTKMAKHLSTLSPNQENTKLYIQCVSVWGKLIACDQMKEWLNSKASQEELANVFTAETPRENYRLLVKAVRNHNQQIPPLINTYIIFIRFNFI